MKRRWICLFFSLFASASLLAQTDSKVLLARAYDFEEAGKPLEVIKIVQPLIDSKQLSASDLGHSWNLLGLALLYLGDLDRARNALEQAIYIFQSQPQETQKYAGVLNNLGGVYREMRQWQTAAQLNLKALHLYEQVRDEEGIARSCDALASIALAQKHINEGRKYIDCLKHAMDLSQHLDLDDLAAMSGVQADLAFLEGDFSTALSGFQRALNLWRSAHGEQYALTALGYFLRGQVYIKTGDIDHALADIRSGLSIMEAISATKHPRYFAAQLEYAQALDANGEHSDAAEIRVKAKDALKKYHLSQCVDCTISVAAFR